MKIKIKKSKCTIIGGKEGRLLVKLEGSEIQKVKEFKYLRSIFTEDLRCTREIKARIALAKEGFRKKRRLLCGHL